MILSSENGGRFSINNLFRTAVSYLYQIYIVDTVAMPIHLHDNGVYLVVNWASKPSSQEKKIIECSWGRCGVLHYVQGDIYPEDTPSDHRNFKPVIKERVSIPNSIDAIRDLCKIQELPDVTNT